MHGLIEWFTRNGVAANLLMIIILASGGMALLNTRQEVFPEFSLDRITITTKYLGAAPEETEEAVSVRIEEAIQGLDGIKRITSNSAEGISSIVVELMLGVDSARVLDEVKARVDAIDTFPDEVEEPVITELTNRRQVIDIAIYGDTDETSLKQVAERVRDELSATPGITAVEIATARPYEISIEVSELDLRRYGLTFDHIARAVRQKSLDLPGGSVKTQAGEILLRAKSQAYRRTDFEDIVVMSRPDGTRVRIADVAQVVDGFAESDMYARFDGQPSVLVEVFRVGQQGALDIAAKVKSYIQLTQPQLPEGIHLAVWQDQAKVLRDRVDLLVRNGISGLILVFITLSLFLRFRLALWVSVGIPISFMGAFWLMPYFDVSINLISLFAFIVVLGIVVDDAIVIGESIFTHQERHGHGLKGAIEGAREVAVPVTFGILTTVAAFFPLMNVEGTIGKVMGVIPVIVISCLLFSFIESKLILPNHLSHVPARKDGQKPSTWRRFQDRFANGLTTFAQRAYAPFVAACLRWRYATVAAVVAVLILTGAMVRGGWIRFEFFPAVEADFVSAALTMPQGTPVEVTSAAVARIEASARELAQELADKPNHSDLFRHVYAAVGDQPYRLAQSRNAGSAGSGNSGSHLGEVTIELSPAEERVGVSSDQLALRWREMTGDIPDAVEVAFSASLFSAGSDIDLQITGRNVERLREAAAMVKEHLRSYDGVSEVADSFREGKQEIQIQITDQAEIWGLTQADLARQVRQAFYGEEAQRIQRGRDDIRVMVRYPRAERESVGNLENLRIRTPQGMEVPFSEVADYSYGRGYAAIKRVDRRRSVNVTADVDIAKSSADMVMARLDREVIPELRERFPEVILSYEGSKAEQRDTLAGLQRGFALALIMIYALLAVPLKSYYQPLIIMTAIPFGLIGAIWGHVLMGMNLTILSMFGIVALAGVVVNDSLVLVDFINRHRNSQEAILDSIRVAGVKRFRPILLTSVTTFMGLLPLLLERSMQARFLIPMAISLAFGVMFATFISLILVPCGYAIGEDASALISGPRDELQSNFR